MSVIQIYLTFSMPHSTNEHGIPEKEVWKVLEYTLQLMGLDDCP